jgi:hypothetical protein
MAILNSLKTLTFSQIINENRKLICAVRHANEKERESNQSWKKSMEDTFAVIR